CTSAGPFGPCSISSARVGENGAGSRMRSKPPERQASASFHHVLSSPGCAACAYWYSSSSVQWSQPRISQRLITRGQSPVEPDCCQVPTSGALRPPLDRLPVCVL